MTIDESQHPDASGPDPTATGNAPAAAATATPPATPHSPPPPAGAAPRDPVRDLEKSLLESQVVEVMRTVYDPEIPVNIYELGMVYDIDVDPPGKVKVKMTLTSPMCPVAGSLPGEVRTRIADIPGITDAQVELVWEPPWDPSRMTEAARLQLGMV